MGRPAEYNEEIAAKICERLSCGESLRSVCRDEDMPSRMSFFRWIAKYPELREQYAIAKEEAAESMVEDMLEIADNGENDYSAHYSDEGVAAYKLNGEAIQRSRLRVDTRKWYLSKIKPKKYGEKLSQEITGADGGPLKTETQVTWTVQPVKPVNESDA